MHKRTFSVAIVCVVGLCTSVGCGGGAPQLMKTPNLYVRGDVDPFLDVPPTLRTNTADVLYLTDRVPLPESKPGTSKYGYGRSRSVRFGVSKLRFGAENVSWDELVRACRTDNRAIDLGVVTTSTTELGEFPPTPRNLVKLSLAATRGLTDLDDDADDAKAAAAGFNKALSERLALTRVKEVYLFVHGYNDTFDDATRTIGQLWHFMGREGVPVAYTWPAGSSGLIRGYTYDRESSEFTVYHLKQAIRLIAANPDVQKVHLLGHSRGTDVTVSALRELHLQISGGGKSTREVLKLGTVVLAAPDLDIDVVIQRMVTARLGQVPERFALYICKQDKALGLSNWLFGGANRLGKLQSDVFSPEELEMLRNQRAVSIVDARISNPGAFGHDYFHSNPAVSSDLILLMRYQLPPGAEYGRPLRIDKSGFWVIDDDYPGPPRKRIDENGKVTDKAPAEAQAAK